MTEPDENEYYFRALVDLLTEAEKQLNAHSSDVNAHRYRELLDELTGALNTAIAASRFILAELNPSGEAFWPGASHEGIPRVH